MKSIALPLFFVYAAAIVYGTTARAMDDDEKNVRLIWFPRFSPDGKTLLTAHGHWNKDDGGEARVFDAGDGTVLKVFKHPRGPQRRLVLQGVVHRHRRLRRQRPDL